MIQTLSNKLKELFDTLKGTWKPFVSVTPYHTLDNTGYPYLCFEHIEYTADILDNCNNLRTFTFEVLIFQEITEAGWRKEATEIIYKAMDDVIDLIDKNYTLGLNNVKMVNPVTWRIEPLTTQNWRSLVGRVLLEIQTYNSVN